MRVPGKLMSDTVPPRSGSRVVGAALALLASLAPVPAGASVTCDEVFGTAPDLTSLRLEITSPAPGSLVPARTGCTGELLVEGLWSVTAPPLLFDFYIVIDESGS